MIKENLRSLALSHGFLACGFARADFSSAHQQYLTALERGGFEGMPYLARGAEARRHPQNVLPGVKTVIAFAESCRKEPSELKKHIADYARALDYHTVIKERLTPVLKFLKEKFPDDKHRVVSDSAPLIEHEWAQRAGVGWIGKNTLTINRTLGSNFLLAEILTTAVFEPDEEAQDFCGSCRACLDACPTGALIKPFQMDASKCISYLTIEHRGDFSQEQKDMTALHVFGCDICQDVCPWNQKPVHLTAAAYKNFPAENFDGLSCRDEAEFKNKFAGTPAERCGFAGWQRNLAAVISSKNR